MVPSQLDENGQAVPGSAEWAEWLGSQDRSHNPLVAGSNPAGPIPPFAPDRSLLTAQPCAAPGACRLYPSALDGERPRTRYICPRPQSRRKA